MALLARRTILLARAHDATVQHDMLDCLLHAMRLPLCCDFLRDTIPITTERRDNTILS